MKLNQYDVDTYEQVLHSIGIDVVDRTAVVSTSNTNYFYDVSMIPMPERRLMGYEVRVDNNVIVYFYRKAIEREEIIIYLAALISLDYIYPRENYSGLWYHVRSLKRSLLRQLDTLRSPEWYAIIKPKSSIRDYNIIHIIKLVQAFIVENMDIFDYKFLFAIPDLRDNFMETCMQCNNGNLFSIALKELSHEYVLDVLDYTTKEEWYEGTVLVEQRLAEFSREDNKKRFDL